jgi:hypothetical protein
MLLAFFVIVKENTLRPTLFDLYHLVGLVSLFNCDEIAPEGGKF